MHYPVLVPTITNKFKLMIPYEYRDITVPSGYKTNGANIPRVFWQIIPPFKPKYLPAILVHDYLCDKEEYHKADAYFKEILYGIEVSARTKAMVLAVKMYHKIKYGVR